MSEQTAVVIGAGPAGLAAAAALQREGIPAVVLERGEAVGAAWRGRYDRLRLNSSKWFSQLPGARYPRGTGVFPTRDQVVTYLGAYAAAQRIDVRLGTQVERIDADASGWTLRTSRGDLQATDVIVASGYQHTPRIPAWPGREAYSKPLLHAADYRNPAPYAGADMLVVGSGCSGMEIANELARNGAGRVRLAVRTSPNILMRSPIGAILGRAALALPVDRADALLRTVQRKTVGDLEPYGLPMPEEGMASRHKRLGVAPAIVDAETIEAIRERKIAIVAGVTGLDATGVALADGSRIEPDAVIAATGYGTGLEPMVGHLGVLDERGIPRAVRGEAADGLRFVGYVPRPGQIGRMGQEGRRAAKEIAERRASHRRRGTWRGIPAAEAAGR